jgi:Cu/Ag efflux protein CusF
MNPAHKSILPVLAAVGIFCAVTNRAWSQVTTNQVKSSSEISRDEARQRRAQASIAKGTIEAIDLLRRQIKLKTEDGSRTFTYTTRTYIFRDKDKITADSLKVGEVVALRFATDKDGAVLVVRIKARTPSELMEPPLLGPATATNPPPASQP